MSITGSEQWMYSAGAAGFYDFPIEQSLRFEDGDSAYLSRTPATAGNRKTWTYSGWVKRGNLDVTTTLLAANNDTNSDTRILIQANGLFSVVKRSAGSTQWIKRTSQVFRDPSAWYHIVVALDTTQATAEDRVKIYINGERVTSWDTNTNPALDSIPNINNTGPHCIGARTSSTDYFDGYMADVNLIDGQALDPTSFGEFKSGIWTPVDTAGLTFGTNGFRLAFADSGAIGDDTSGNTNDWTANNLVASDVVLDSPTNNFAVLRNMGTPPASGAGLQEGNLHYTTGSSGSGRNLNRQAISTILPASGKWYAECRVQSSTNQFIGVGTYQVEILPTANNTRYSYIRPLAADVYTRTGSSETITSNYGSAGAVGDVFGVYLDLDASPPEVYYSKNGSWGDGSGNFDEATPTTAITLGDSFLTTDNGGNQGVGFIFSSAASGTSVEGIWNFGQDSTFAGNEASGGNTDANGLGDFFSTVPDGALSLCSANLPSGAIDTLNDETPEDYFSALTYSGTGASNSVTGIGFQPSLTWIKQRTQAYSHELYDAVRGVQKALQSNTTSAESTETQGLTSFDSDGFTVGTRVNVNQSSTNLVSWNWKANGAGVSNTDGSITSTVSVGATSQQNWFSISEYTGTGSSMTWGHGLGVKPDLFIVKKTNSADEWIVYPLGATGNLTQYLKLHTTAGYTSDSVLETANSSVLGFGSSGARNGNGDDYICYAFANAEGLCKVGSYTGNGSTDGTFIHTGFRPAFVMWKRTDTTSDWFMMDVKRDIDNPTDHKLEANSSGSEVVNTAYYTDYLSNGFKLRNTNGQLNASGGNYIYLALASQPFKYANAR